MQCLEKPARLIFRFLFASDDETSAASLHGNMMINIQTNFIANGFKYVVKVFMMCGNISISFSFSKKQSLYSGIHALPTTMPVKGKTSGHWGLPGCYVAHNQ